MKPLFICLSFFLFSIRSYAVERGVITGTVIEQVGALPIPSAVVAIYDPGSEQPLSTTPTDENGTFKFSALKYGTYKIIVRYVGFAPLTVNDIILTDKDFEKNLGNLKLSSDQNNLDEVTISAEKPVIEFAADMITYNVDKSMLAEGSTATDILKNVPMVEVDIDGNATISGKRSTRIFIDGKPSDYMTSNISDLLNVLPSDAIQKIEVMTNPPVKYSGDGEGIINIVLKKGFKIGFNGNIGVTAGLQGNTNANTSASYKSKTYSLNGSAAYRHRLGKNGSHSYRENYFPDTSFYYDNYSDSRNLGNGGNFRVGFDWDITPKQNIRISSNYNANLSDNNSGTDYHYLDEELVESRLKKQINTADGNSGNFVFNVDYELKTDTTGGELSLGATYNTNSNQNHRLLDRNFVFPANLAPSLQQNNNETGNNGLNFNMDYSKPIFKKRDRIEVGLMYNYRKNDNNQLIQNFDFDTQQYVINDKLSNRFLYNENIMAGYASYNFRGKGWGAKAGVRGELTDVLFNLSTGDQYDIKPYLSLFPNFSVNRYFKKRYSIGATYSVRINRPRENTLNPQVNNNDPMNISYGNPDLKPAYTHQMDVSFGTFGEKWSFTPRLSYSTSKGVIERYRTVFDTGISETTYDNVGTNKSFALNLIGNYRPYKKISTNAHFSVIQSDYQSKLNAALNRKGRSLRGAVGVSMQLPLKTAVEGNVNYANNLNAQGRSKGSVTTWIGARKIFFKNKLNTRVTVSDPFGSRNNTSYNEGTNFRLQNYYTSNTSNVTLSLSYRFTKINKVPPPPKP